VVVGTPSVWGICFDMLQIVLRRLWQPTQHSCIVNSPANMLQRVLMKNGESCQRSLLPLCGQVRFGPKDARPGRPEHHCFGVTKPKGRGYYRFHKLIGKWNWRKYTERYLAPRALENRQRWRSSTSPSHGHVRESRSWFWRLPTALAKATTSDEVLEAWVQFRHKHPKRTYHYFKVLKRLVDVGGCDPTDWRLKLVTSRLHVVHRRVLNIPRLAKFYADLRVTDELEHLTRYLYPMLHKYSPQQLVLAAHAYGCAHLQDKRIFADVAHHLGPHLAVVTPSDLARLVQAFAAVEICNYPFLSLISAQLQVRIQQASMKQAPARSCPTLEQLAEVGEAFAKLKFQDFSYMEMCAMQSQHLLENGLPGPTPPVLAQLCSACAKLKIYEVRFFEHVLAHIKVHWYDYPAVALADIGSSVSPILPRESDQVQHVYRQMLSIIAADSENLDLHGVSLASRFMAELDHKGEFMPGVAERLTRQILNLRDDSQEHYDIARVTEIFARRCPENRALFSCLCRHLHRHLAIFEPVDFVRFSRGLLRSEYRDSRATHALAKWATKRKEEFSTNDWSDFSEHIASLRQRAFSGKLPLVETGSSASPATTSQLSI